MNTNLIKFYLTANKLKNVIRTGWQELEVSSDRLESVAEHIYGCLILAIGLESEYKLDLDMLKVFKMLTLKELKKVNLKETTTRDYLNENHQEESLIASIAKITEGLIKAEEIKTLMQEYDLKQSKEAKFAYQVSKLEADLQAKIYDLNGYMPLDVAKEDAKYFGEELANEIIPKIQNASDGFILYDRHLYEDDIFKDLSTEVENIKSL